MMSTVNEDYAEGTLPRDRRPSVFTKGLLKKFSHFQCLLCEYQTMDGNKVEEHVFVHCDGMPFKCAACSRHFFKRSRYYHHQIKDHPDQRTSMLIHKSLLEKENYAIVFKDGTQIDVDDNSLVIPIPDQTNTESTIRNEHISSTEATTVAEQSTKQLVERNTLTNNAHSKSISTKAASVNNQSANCKTVGCYSDRKSEAVLNNAVNEEEHTDSNVESNVAVDGDHNGNKTNDNTEASHDDVVVDIANVDSGSDEGHISVTPDTPVASDGNFAGGRKMDCLPNDENECGSDNGAVEETAVQNSTDVISKKGFIQKQYTMSNTGETEEPMVAILIPQRKVTQVMSTIGEAVLIDDACKPRTKVSKRGKYCANILKTSKRNKKRRRSDDFVTSSSSDYEMDDEFIYGRKSPDIPTGRMTRSMAKPVFNKCPPLPDYSDDSDNSVAKPNIKSRVAKEKGRLKIQNYATLLKNNSIVAHGSGDESNNNVVDVAGVGDEISKCGDDETLATVNNNTSGKCNVHIDRVDVLDRSTDEGIKSCGMKFVDSNSLELGCWDEEDDDDDSDYEADVNDECDEDDYSIGDEDNDEIKQEIYEKTPDEYATFTQNGLGTSHAMDSVPLASDDIKPATSSLATYKIKDCCVRLLKLDEAFIRKITGLHKPMSTVKTDDIQSKSVNKSNVPGNETYQRLMKITREFLSTKSQIPNESEKREIMSPSVPSRLDNSAETSPNEYITTQVKKEIMTPDKINTESNWNISSVSTLTPGTKKELFVSDLAQPSSAYNNHELSLNHHADNDVDTKSNSVARSKSWYDSSVQPPPTVLTNVTTQPTVQRNIVTDRHIFARGYKTVKKEPLYIKEEPGCPQTPPHSSVCATNVQTNYSRVTSPIPYVFHRRSPDSGPTQPMSPLATATLQMSNRHMPVVDPPRVPDVPIPLLQASLSDSSTDTSASASSAKHMVTGPLGSPSNHPQDGGYGPIHTTDNASLMFPYRLVDTQPSTYPRFPRQHNFHSTSSHSNPVLVQQPNIRFVDVQAKLNSRTLKPYMPQINVPMLNVSHQQMLPYPIMRHDAPKANLLHYLINPMISQTNGSPCGNISQRDMQQSCMNMAIPQSHMTAPTLPSSHRPHSHANLVQSTTHPNLPRQILPKQILPKQNLPQQNLPKKNLPQQHLLQQNLPQQHLPRQNLPRQNLPQQNLPQQNLPQQNLPQQILPQQILPQQILPQQILPQLKMFDNIMPYVDSLNNPQSRHAVPFSSQFNYLSAPQVNHIDYTGMARSASLDSGLEYQCGMPRFYKNPKTGMYTPIYQ